ncbi:MAG: cyclodeaminase/cyclohydrolase family protein [Clostridia bacterium]|nr:cyclodeaminase/cyclohydrolase family protein [Clostridia bacterium]
MRFADKTCTEFVDILSTKSAVPGGGGAAALTGAIGVALGSMVCNLTIGKRKYAEYEDRVKSILERAKELERDLIKMIDDDAECFLPLSKAYGMKSHTEEEKKLKEETLERALKDACGVPIQIVKTAYEAIKLHEELVDIGSRLAISDVGVGVQCLRAALISGQLNVLININSIKDEQYIKEVKKQTENLVKDGIEIADTVYKKVEDVIMK